MTSHAYFLRWLWANVVFALVGVGLCLSFVHHIHGAPLAVACIILAITVFASALAGLAFWRLDLGARSTAQGAVQHIDSVIYSCQVLAALGAILGVYLTATARDVAQVGIAAAASGVLDAMANGLLATFTGIICSLFLFWVHHFLHHVIE